MLSKSISEFYEGKHIFLTGATGLLGKSIMEKLLRTCGGLKSIYVLIRPKKGVNVENRLQNLLSSELFDLVKDEDPTMLTKIKAMEGDICKENFGLNTSDIEELKNNVNVIIHSAATVRFNEPLRVAVDMNVVPVIKLIDLALKIKHLEIIVHISTAYSNCDHEVIQEHVYPSTINPYTLVDMVHSLDDDLLDIITPRLLKDMPNTYTFTKKLAENIIQQYLDRLPIVIVRPSIICASVAEPFPGWVDNFNAITGVIAAASQGILRSMMGDYTKSADIIPVDTTANFIIAIGWYSAGTYKTSLTNGDIDSEELSSISQKLEKSVIISKYLNKTVIPHIQFIPVFNCTLDKDTVTWGTFVKSILRQVQQSPSISCQLFPNFHMTTLSWYHNTKWLFSHIIPAAVMDLCQLFQGHSPRYLCYMDRLRKNLFKLCYFTLHNWDFVNKNKCMVWRAMSGSDQINFNFELSNVDWVSYLNLYHHGTKLYALKESINTNCKSFSRGKKLRALYFGLRYLAMIVPLLVLMNKIHFFNRLFYQLLKVLIRGIRITRFI